MSLIILLLCGAVKWCPVSEAKRLFFSIVHIGLPQKCVIPLKAKSRMSKFLEKLTVVTRPSENLWNVALKETKYLPKSRNYTFLEGNVINDKFISLTQLLCSIQVCSNVLADVAMTTHPHLAPRLSMNIEL